MRRHPAILLAGAALLLFAGVVLAQYQDQPQQRQQQDQQWQQQNQQNQQWQQQNQPRSQRDMPQHHQPQGQAQGSGTQLYLGSATIIQVQQKLQQEGQNVGPIDGQWGQKTSQALKNFQQERQLHPTGHVDLPTLSALGISSCQIAMGGQYGQSQMDQRTQTWNQQSQQRTRQTWQQNEQEQPRTQRDQQTWRQQDRQRTQQDLQQQDQQHTQHGQQTWQQHDQRTQQTYQQQGRQPGMQAGRMDPSASSAAVPLYAGPEVVQEIHSKLQSMGHNVGNQPKWGSQMKQAVRQFQQSSDLEPTGNLDFETLAALGVHDFQGGQQPGQQVGQRDDRQQQNQQDRTWRQQNRQQDPQRRQQSWDQQDQQNQQNRQQSWDQQDQQRTQQTWRQQNQTTQQQTWRQQNQQTTQRTTWRQQNQQSQMKVSQADLVPIYISPSAVRQVQRSLEQQGQNLSVDGVFGPQTSQALRQFQQKQNLGANGRIDFETLCALDLAQSIDDLAMIGDRERETLTRRNRPGQQPQGGTRR